MPRAQNDPAAQPAPEALLRRSVPRFWDLFQQNAETVDMILAKRDLYRPDDRKVYAGALLQREHGDRDKC